MKDLITHHGERFHNRTIILDGRRFIDCEFINPELRYRGGAPFECTGNRFEGSTNIEFHRGGEHSKPLIAVLDRAFRDAGWDLQLAKRFARSRQLVWRFHTRIPIYPSPEAAGGSPA